MMKVVREITLKVFFAFLKGFSDLDLRPTTRKRLGLPAK